MGTDREPTIHVQLSQEQLFSQLKLSQNFLGVVLSTASVADPGNIVIVIPAITLGQAW